VVLAIDKQITELGLTDEDPDLAECVVYAWALKTKLYMIGETSKTCPAQIKQIILKELNDSIEMTGQL